MGECTTGAVGYVMLCLLGELTYAVVVLTVCLLHIAAARGLTHRQTGLA